MKKSNAAKVILSAAVCFVLIAAAALVTFLCKDKASDTEPVTSPESSEVSKLPSDSGITAVGEGKTEFSFTVTDKDGKSTVFSVRTDEKMLGQALLGCNLIEGEAGQYGLYVKKVNGITADYNTDGTFWALYVDGESSSVGVDSVEITAGKSYEFRVSK